MKYYIQFLEGVTPRCTARISPWPVAVTLIFKRLIFLPILAFAILQMTLYLLLIPISL